MTIDFGEANAKQRLFYLSTALYTAYGGARGGGKSHAVRIKALGGALGYAGITILILRRTYNDLQNSIIEPMLKMIPQGLGVYNGTMHMIYFANNSTIKFGHYDSDSSREYQGQQYDWIFIDEATQFTYDEFRTLGGCLRGVNTIPRRFYLTCNPGGVGHAWVKRLFIDKDYINDPKNPEANENPEDYNFIFATVEDNAVLLENSPQYLQMLASLPEDIRRAHRYGDWDALAGQYFSEFRKDTHTIEPFAIPDNWVRYRAFDYGLDMFACLWIAVDFNGRCYVYREARVKKLIVSEAAALMQEMTLPNEKIEYNVEVTLDLANDELGWDIGPSQSGSAPVQRSVPLRRSAPGSPTRQAMLNGKVGKVEKLEATVAQQQKQIETLTAQLREQAAQIQKVSAQLEMVRPTPRVVENR
jgi:phage terminase large subunit